MHPLGSVLQVSNISCISPRGQIQKLQAANCRGCRGWSGLSPQRSTLQDCLLILTDTEYDPSEAGFQGLRSVGVAEGVEVCRQRSILAQRPFQRIWIVQFVKGCRPGDTRQVPGRPSWGSRIHGACGRRIGRAKFASLLENIDFAVRAL